MARNLSTGNRMSRREQAEETLKIIQDDHGYRFAPGEDTLCRKKYANPDRIWVPIECGNELSSFYSEGCSFMSREKFDHRVGEELEQAMSMRSGLRSAAKRSDESDEWDALFHEWDADCEKLLLSLEQKSKNEGGSGGEKEEKKTDARSKDSEERENDSKEEDNHDGKESSEIAKAVKETETGDSENPVKENGNVEKEADNDNSVNAEDNSVSEVDETDADASLDDPLDAADDAYYPKNKIDSRAGFAKLTQSGAKEGRSLFAAFDIEITCETTMEAGFRAAQESREKFRERVSEVVSGSGDFKSRNSGKSGAVSVVAKFRELLRSQTKTLSNAGEAGLDDTDNGSVPEPVDPATEGTHKRMNGGEEVDGDQIIDADEVDVEVVHDESDANNKPRKKPSKKKRWEDRKADKEGKEVLENENTKGTPSPAKTDESPSKDDSPSSESERSKHSKEGKHSPAKPSACKQSPRNQSDKKTMKSELSKSKDSKANPPKSSLSLAPPKIAVLNFASAKNPGGGFLRGSIAQEECLAKASTLYMSLIEHRSTFYSGGRGKDGGNSQSQKFARGAAFKAMYEQGSSSSSSKTNRDAVPNADTGTANTNAGKTSTVIPKNWGEENMYTDRVIYSPNILFFRDDSGQLLSPKHVGLFDVVTCASVNQNALSGGGGRVRNPSQQVIEQQKIVHGVMSRRAKRVLMACEQHGADVLVLGAWGTGVFRNSAESVAGWFVDAMRRLQGKVAFRKIIFAIPDKTKASVFSHIFRVPMSDGK